MTSLASIYQSSSSGFKAAIASWLVGWYCLVYIVVRVGTDESIDDCPMLLFCQHDRPRKSQDVLLAEIELLYPSHHKGALLQECFRVFHILSLGFPCQVFQFIRSSWLRVSILVD